MALQTPFTTPPTVTPIPVVLCAITREDRLLLIRREQEPYAGFWGLVGGKLKAGETIEEAALREAREETGLEVSLERVSGFVNETLLERGELTAHFLLFICRLRSAEGTPRAGPEGELRWFEVGTLPREKPRIIPTDYLMITRIVVASSPGIRIAEASMERHDCEYQVRHFDLREESLPDQKPGS